MAVLMAANPGHLWNHAAKKYCRDYFYDFQHFLRESLSSREFQKLVAYPPKEDDRVANILLKTLQQICKEIFVGLPAFHSIASSIKHLMIEAGESTAAEKGNVGALSIGSRLSRDYSSMGKLLRRHSNGPLSKVLEVIEDNNVQSYDSLMQNNLPQVIYNLNINNNEIKVIRLPCPTSQEVIHKAAITEEFKTYLRSTDSVEGKLFLINLQDRSSWREFFRAQALEDLQNVDGYSSAITTSTLACDSEFYQQLTPYHEDNKYESFKAHFLEQVKDEMCGFFMPTAIHRKISQNWVERTLDGIHLLFFGGRNVMSRERRLDFIEIFYYFLELKMIEIVNPSTLSFTCKDSLDTGSVNSVAIYLFLKLINGQSLSEDEVDGLNIMLYGPSMLVRERLILPERFNRLVSTIKLIESVRDEKGSVEFPQAIQQTFSPLFETPILQAFPSLAY